MKKILLFIFSTGALLVSAQSINLGLEVMPKRNTLVSPSSEDYYNYSDPQFIALDNDNDSLGFFFTDFKKTTNVEIPIYLRYRTKGRWTFDLSYSLSKFSIQGSGKTAYVGNFYEKYYPKEEYKSALIDEGYTEKYADSVYTLFIHKQEDYWTGDFNYVEDIKLRSFGFNATYKFLPHKAYKPFAQVGLVYRKKVSNYSFQNFDLQNTYINDLSQLSNAIVKFSETMIFFKMGLGVEFYRFRLGLNLDLASNGNSIEPYTPNNRIVGRQSDRPYTSVRSLGFYIGADLFGKDLASKKQNTESNQGISEIPKVKMKQDRWSLGLRLNTSIRNKFEGYYTNDNPLTVVSQQNIYTPYPSVALGDQYYLSALTIKDISLVDYRPQVEGFFRKNFLKRFLAEGYMGYNTLKMDFATTEMKALWTQAEVDTMGGWDWFLDEKPKNSQVYSGVFRKSWGIFNLGANLMYEVVSQDLLKVRLSGGFNVNFMIENAFTSSTRDNVNSSDLAYDFNNWMESGANKTTENLLSGDLLFVTEDKIDYDIYESDYDAFIEPFQLAEYKFLPNQQDLQYYQDDELFSSKQAYKSSYGSFRFGVEAEFNRIILGMYYEANLKYMQGILLKSYNNFALSFGYLLFKK